MKRVHFPSFGMGLASGLLILVLAFGGMRLMGGTPRRAGLNGGLPSVARMAERFGMTQAELQGELDLGKTMQQIAEEHGVQFGGGRPGGGMRSSLQPAGSGASVSSAAQSASSL